jgi:hypothetical protein
VVASYVVTLAPFVAGNHQTAVVMLGLYAAQKSVASKASRAAAIDVASVVQSAVQGLVSYCHPSSMRDKPVHEPHWKVVLTVPSALGAESANL